MYSDLKLCKVIVRDGKHYITDPDGNILPKQIMTRITDPLSERPYALVKLFVELINTEENIK